MNKIAIYPGSFDPISFGHLPIIRDAANLFDKLIIGVGNNLSKKGLIPINDRISLILLCIAEYIKVDIEVERFDGLLAKYCRENEISYIVRGLRDVSDFQLEINMSFINRDLNPKLKTIFIPAEITNSYISSSAIREIFINGGELPSNYVPKPVKEYLEENAEKLRIGKSPVAQICKSLGIPEKSKL